jgi:hypothetical protein
VILYWSCASSSPLQVFNGTVIFYFTGNALEDLNLDEPLNLAASLDKDLETDSPNVSNSISAGLASSGKYFICNIRTYIYIY